MLTSPWYIIAAVLLGAGLILGLVLLVIWLYRHFQNEYYVEYSTPDYSTEAGYYFVSLPHSEILTPQRYWLINRRTAEVEYEIAAGKTAQLRVAETGRLTLPEDYQNAPYESVATVEIDGIPVTHHHTPGGLSMTRWSRDGFDYALLMPDLEMNMLNGITNDFVTGARLAQGD